MPLAGSYYLAYVEPGTAFDPAVHNVMDEYVFDIDLKISEGDKPVLTLEILNPHIGLLNSSRLTWVWFSRMEANGHIEPRFYGRVMAVPTNLAGEVITVNYIAWPEDFFEQRQALAEAIRVAGPYDEVFIDPSKADDPDAVLEAVSGRYCVDPITNVVTVEDFIEASDGNNVITAAQHLYDGFSIEVDQQAPLTSVLMDATVGWNQTAIGYVDMSPPNITSYSGDGVINDWPKPLTQLGGGWSVFNGLASDANYARTAFVGSLKYHWQSGEKEHADGDALTVDETIAVPSMISSYQSAVIFWRQQVGFLDPFAVDVNGDPSPVNIPPSFDQTMMFVPLMNVSTALVLRYDAVRPRTERILMLLNADMQATIVDPLVTQYTETIKKTGRNVGYPIINLLDWTTIAGQTVEVGTVVFPDLPTLPGGQSIQVATTPGTAGTVQPNFSDVAGDTTTDNTVVWASLGQNAPSDGNYPDWTGVTNVALGTIWVPRQPPFITAAALVAPGLVQFPQTGVEVAIGQIMSLGPGAAYVCTLGGLTGIGSPFGGDVEWSFIGNLPDGKTLFLATAVTGPTGAQYVIPAFGASTALHSTVADGGVTWTNIGPGDIPAGGTLGNVWARSYFDTDRGKRSIEYLISILRAKMRLRGRAVKVGFDMPADLSSGMNCRQTTTVEDTRIPGGIGLGKNTLINLKVNGDRGEEIVHVEIGCAIGKDNAVTVQPGEPTWADADYVGSDYQVFDGQVVTLPDLSDVGYTPPTAPGVDDGIVFSDMTKSQVVVSELVRGTLSDQVKGIQSAFASARKAAVLAQQPVASLSASINIQQQIAQANANSVALQLQLHPVWYELTLKPLNRPFSNVFRVPLTDLTMEKGVDLAGAYTP